MGSSESDRYISFINPTHLYLYHIMISCSPLSLDRLAQEKDKIEEQSQWWPDSEGEELIIFTLIAHPLSYHQANLLQSLLQSPNPPPIKLINLTPNQDPEGVLEEVEVGVEVQRLRSQVLIIIISITTDLSTQANLSIEVEEDVDEVGMTEVKLVVVVVVLDAREAVIISLLKIENLQRPFRALKPDRAKRIALDHLIIPPLHQTSHLLSQAKQLVKLEKIKKVSVMTMWARVMRNQERRRVKSRMRSSQTEVKTVLHVNVDPERLPSRLRRSQILQLRLLQKFVRKSNLM